MKKLPRSNNSNGIIAMKKSGQNKIIIVAGVLVVVACFFCSIPAFVHEQGTLV